MDKLSSSGSSHDRTMLSLGGGGIVYASMMEGVASGGGVAFNSGYNSMYHFIMHVHRKIGKVWLIDRASK